MRTELAGAGTVINRGKELKRHMTFLRTSTNNVPQANGGRKQEKVNFFSLIVKHFLLTLIVFPEVDPAAPL